MISSEVQRTLVKSPPELWTELSDPAALTRHLAELGALGEIRIVRCEPEKLVEWEAEGTNGKVQIKPSGWGTKVTLSVTREIVLAEADVEEAAEEQVLESAEGALPNPGEESISREPVRLEAEAPQEPEAIAFEPEAVVEDADGGDPDPEPVAHEPLEPPVEHTLDESVPSADAASAGLLDETAPVSAPTNPAPRRGFFARLFGRRKPEDAAEPVPGTPIEDPVEQLPTSPARERSASAIEALQARFQPVETTPTTAGPDLAEKTGATAAQDLTQAPPTDEAAEQTPDEELSAVEPNSTVDLAAELQAAEEVAVAEVRAVLTAVLDRLGAAHHRPFSRA